MADLGTIEALAKTYAAARDELAEATRVTTDMLDRVKAQRTPVIRRRVEAASNARAQLEAAIAASKPLFKSPKTITLHGIRCGFAKAKGKIVIVDDQATVKAIRRHLPEQFETLVKVTEKPLKGALQNLSAADLKRIGVTVEEATDEVVAKAADGEIDKLVEALLKDAADAAELQEAEG